MNNIPVFATENGVGSLVLKDIPYTKAAYIKMESVSCFESFLEECVSFCTVVGAEYVYATGHEALRSYALHTCVWRMSCLRETLSDTDAALFPVTEQTLEIWLDIYREKMKKIPNAAYMSLNDGREMLKSGDGYFIHEADALLGIGRANGDKIDLVASLQPGAGRKIVLALNHALSGEHAQLEVASANEKAVKLYESLGFMKTSEISKWYKII